MNTTVVWCTPNAFHSVKLVKLVSDIWAELLPVAAERFVPPE